MNTKDHAVSGNVSTERALDLALEALERLDGWLALRYGSGLTPQEQQVVTAIKQALAQPAPVQEPLITDEKGRPMTFWGGKATPPAAPEEPVYHLRQFGDVTKEQLNRYMATGDINPQPAPVQEPAWYHAECDDPDYSRFTQEKDEAFAIVSDKGGYVTPLYTVPPAAPVQETEVSWGVDWGRVGDRSCAMIIKRLPDGKIEVVAVEYEP